jgi:hypothetical protein
MIQLSWLELVIFLFSAIVCGAVLYSFFIPEKNLVETAQTNADEELIGADVQRRLRAYDLEEQDVPSQQHGKVNDQYTQLSNQIRILEEQIRELKSASVDYSAENKPELRLVSEDENDTVYPDSGSSEEDDYLQAKEELELALFKAKRQLSRYQTSLQDHSQNSSAEPNSTLHDEQFRTELEKTTQLIEQLYLSFQKNPHTSYSLLQMKQRVLKEMDMLADLAQKLHPVKS